jgi:ABC-type hemin transport system substrate-binding protein
MNVRSSIRLILLAIACVVAACKPANNSAPSKASTPNANAVRIISLSPAISRALVDFNLKDKIVGRTPFCASLDQSIPDVGDLLNINYEHLIRLGPTHILVQPPETGVDANLQQLAQQHEWKIVRWKLDSLDDIETMVREIPAALFADGSDELTQASQRSAELLNQIATALSPGEKPAYPGRTMLVYSLAPLSVFGEGTYLDGVLKALGGANATSARNWASFSAEDFVRLNPQAIILIRPGLETNSIAVPFGTIWEMDIDAVNERRLAILKHPESFLPSTSVIAVAAEMRAILEKFQAERP